MNDKTAVEIMSFFRDQTKGRFSDNQSKKQKFGKFIVQWQNINHELEQIHFFLKEKRKIPFVLINQIEEWLENSKKHRKRSYIYLSRRADILLKQKKLLEKAMVGKEVKEQQLKKIKDCDEDSHVSDCISRSNSQPSERSNKKPIENKMVTKKL